MQQIEKEIAALQLDDKSRERPTVGDLCMTKFATDGRWYARAHLDIVKRVRACVTGSGSPAGTAHLSRRWTTNRDLLMYSLSTMEMCGDRVSAYGVTVHYVGTWSDFLVWLLQHDRVDLRDLRPISSEHLSCSNPCGVGTHELRWLFRRMQRLWH